MQYIIARDFYLDAAGVQLTAGDVVQDGDFEPDVVAQLVSSGILASDSPAVIEPPFEEKADEPTSRWRKRGKGS